MKRIAFVVSWFYKTFNPTTILVTIFHICTWDDVTLVNEKSIVSWKYMKSNKKRVFNVNFQYNHKQVPTANFSMMFNIHKHMSHLIFVLVPECGEYEICNQKIILMSISRQWPFFIDRFLLLLLPGKGRNSINECLCPVIKNSTGPREQTSLLCYTMQSSL